MDYYHYHVLNPTNDVGGWGGWLHQLWHFEKVFHSRHGHKLIKTQKFLHFSDKKCPFTQSFAKQPYIFSRDSDLTSSNVRLSVSQLPIYKIKLWDSHPCQSPMPVIHTIHPCQLSMLVIHASHDTPPLW